MYRMDCPGGLVRGTLPIPMVWVLWQLLEGSCMLYPSLFPLTKVGVGRVTTKGLSAGQSGSVSRVLAGYSQAVDRGLYSLDLLQPSNLSHQRHTPIKPHNKAASEQVQVHPSTTHQCGKPHSNATSEQVQVHPSTTHQCGKTNTRFVR